MKKIVLMMLVVLLGVSGFAQDGEYVDLGLPSGTKWKTVNEKRQFKSDAADAIFGKELPSKEQWEELKEKCKWVWVYGDDDDDIQSGYYVIGPNGKRIFLPAAGYRHCSFGGVNFEGSSGHYWCSHLDGSDYDWFLYFDSDSVSMDGDLCCCHSHSVRLVQD